MLTFTFLILFGLTAITLCAMMQHPDEVVQFVSVFIQTLNAKAMTVVFALLTTPVAVVFSTSVLKSVVNGVLVPLKEWALVFVISRMGSLADAILAVGSYWLTSMFVADVLDYQFAPSLSTRLFVYSAFLLFYVAARVHTCPSALRGSAVCFLSCMSTFLCPLVDLDIGWFTREPISATYAHLTPVPLILLAAYLSSGRKPFEQRAAPVDGGKKSKVQQDMPIPDGNAGNDSGDIHTPEEETIAKKKAEPVRAVFKRKRPLGLSKERWLQMERYRERLAEAVAFYDKEERLWELQQEAAKAIPIEDPPERSSFPFLTTSTTPPTTPLATPLATNSTLLTILETGSTAPKLTASKSSLPGSCSLFLETESSTESGMLSESLASEEDTDESVEEEEMGNNLEQAKGVEDAEIGEKAEDGGKVVEVEDQGAGVEAKEAQEGEQEHAGPDPDVGLSAPVVMVANEEPTPANTTYQAGTVESAVPVQGSHVREPVQALEQGGVEQQPAAHGQPSEDEAAIFVGLVALEPAPADIPTPANEQNGSPLAGSIPAAEEPTGMPNLAGQAESSTDHLESQLPAPIGQDPAPPTVQPPLNQPETLVDTTLAQAPQWNPVLNPSAPGYPMAAPQLAPVSMDFAPEVYQQQVGTPLAAVGGQFGYGGLAHGWTPPEPAPAPPGDDMDIEQAGPVNMTMMDVEVPVQVEEMEVDEFELVDTPMGSPALIATGLPDTPMGSPVLGPFQEEANDIELPPAIELAPPPPPATSEPAVTPPKRIPRKKPIPRLAEVAKSRLEYWAGARPTKPTKPRKRRASAVSSNGLVVPSLWLDAVYHATFVEWEETGFVPQVVIPHIPGTWMPRPASSTISQQESEMQQPAMADMVPQLPTPVQPEVGPSPDDELAL